MTYWFTADPHYGHDNIRKYCDRPFDNVHEMNEALVANHNSVVGVNDHVFFEGDFAFRTSTGRAIELLKRLNGKKYFIAGNHDKTLFRRDDDFKIVVRPEIEYYVEWVKDYHELTIQDKSVKRGKTMIVLSHYSHRVWNKSHWGSWMLYGHSHGSLPEDPSALSIDVGVDAVAKRYATDGVVNPEDYRPICYEEIKVIMDLKSNAQVDHHSPRLSE